MSVGVRPAELKRIEEYEKECWSCSEVCYKKTRSQALSFGGKTRSELALETGWESENCDGCFRFIAELIIPPPSLCLFFVHDGVLLLLGRTGPTYFWPYSKISTFTVNFILLLIDYYLKNVFMAEPMARAVRLPFKIRVNQSLKFLLASVILHISKGNWMYGS